MGSTVEQEIYLRAILATVARQTFPPERLAELVGTGKKQLAAFNLLDGTKSQSEVAKQLSIDPASMSRTIARWIEAGIALRVGDGKEARVIHVYPLPHGFVTGGKGSDE